MLLRAKKALFIKKSQTPFDRGLASRNAEILKDKITKAEISKGSTSQTSFI